MTGRDAAQAAVALARRLGLSAEAFYSSSRELEVRCFRGEVEHFERAEAGGLGLRVIRDGSAGSAYTEDLSRVSVEEALTAAAEIAEYLEPQKGVEISDWPAAAELPGLECPDIAAAPVERKIEMAARMEAAARAAGPEVTNVPWAGYGETQIEVYVLNTAGLERAKRLGSAQLFVEALASRGAETKTFSEHCFARRLSELDPKKLGRSAGESAIGLLGARAPASGRRNIFFSPRTFAGMLAAFSPMFSGRAAEEGRSAMAGRLGKRIGAEGVFLSDDATLPGAPASRPFDSEGVPTRRLAVVEGGVFRSFMHTADTARRAGRCRRCA
jgi:PmbA protein